MRRKIICKNCEQLKQHMAFGLCRVCYLKKYQQENKGILKAKRKEYYQKNREILLAQKKEYRQKHREQFKAKNEKYREKHKEELNKYRRDYYYSKTEGETLIKNYGNGNKTMVYKGGKAVHRVIAEKALGRRLKPNEVIHHIDCNPLNNQPSNLIICSNSFHFWLHKSYNSYLNNPKEG